MSSDPGSLLSYKDRLFFNADANAYDTELWTTDGTVEGPRMFWESPLQPLAVINGTIILRDDANEQGAGPFLWSSDGTPEGAVRLESPLVERLWNRSMEWVEFGGEFFFSGSDQTPWLYPYYPLSMMMLRI